MDFADIVVLQIIDYRLTIEKLKEMLTTVKPMIVDLIKRYELSGMGALNRDSSADDWGSLISLYASKETTERNSFVNIIIFTYCTGGMFWRERERAIVKFYLCQITKTFDFKHIKFSSRF